MKFGHHQHPQAMGATLAAQAGSVHVKCWVEKNVEGRGQKAHNGIAWVSFGILESITGISPSLASLHLGKGLLCRDVPLVLQLP